MPVQIQQTPSSLVPTTQVWEISSFLSDDTDPKLRSLLVRMYQQLNLVANTLNVKDYGFYDTQELINSQTFFPNPANSSATQLTAINRPVYRTVINFGALPNAGAKSVAHELAVNEQYSFTRIYATATKPTVAYSYIPIPYASASGADNIELSVDGTNVTITTASNKSAYTICYVVLEYLKM